MDFPEINLDDLTWRYTANQGVVEVIKLLDAAISGDKFENLAGALSARRAPNLTGEEFRVRRAINSLLSFYGALEIASLIRFVPDPLPEKLRQAALSHLRYEALRRYYERYRPLLLPERFRERLERKLSLRSPDNAESANFFIRFLQLNGMIEEDNRVAAFEALLEAKLVQGCSVEDLMRTLGSPESFMRRMERPPARQEALDLALHGLFIYLSFCYEFDILLQQSSKHPRLRSSMWLYHGHWFDINRERVAKVLTRAIEQIREWPRRSPIELEQVDETEALRESEESINKTLASISRLFSNKYRPDPAPPHRASATKALNRRRIVPVSKPMRRAAASGVSRGPIQATVILDSGCFLKNLTQGPYTEIGYFGSSMSKSDIRVIADGKEVNERLKLGEKSQVEVRHVKATGKIKQEGVRAEEDFHKKILHLSDVYGHHIPVDRSKFDSIIRFDSGRFVAMLIKPRAFDSGKYKRADGKLAMLPDETPKDIRKAIAHTVQVQFTLKKGEALELARNGKVFWSSRTSGAKNRVELEIIADNSTWKKFYCDIFKEKLDQYWMPHEGDPPPMCPEPPCYP